jgi:hypothetical protein
VPALSLFVTLVCVHLLMLAGKPVELSVWTLPALLWQDAAIALGFGVLAHWVRRPLIVWPLYGAIAAYAAINAVVAQVLPSPLTPAMWRAARGTLGDSITWYATLPNLLVCAGVLAVAAVAPLALRRVGSPSPRLLGAAAVAIVAIGPYASSRVETGGWHRNAFGALLPQRLPDVDTAEPPGGWRQSPFAPGAGSAAGTAPDLAPLRAAAQGRNVVLIALESTGARFLAPYGAADDPMPNVSALAARSVLFESAYAVYPESIKGLYAVLCSRHPALDVAAETLARGECNSLTRELDAVGYQSALFHSGRFDYLGMREIVEGLGFDYLADAGTLTGRLNSSFGIDEATTVEAMLSWVDAREPDRPFFLVYLPIAGHHPYVTTSPGPYPPVDERRRYLNVLHEADGAIGRFLRGIGQRGLDGNTLYIVFGDHGEAFGEHPGNIGHSFYLYEENVRVPYFIAVPGLVTETRRATHTISAVDTAPTVLDLLGLSMPGGYEGGSALDGRERMALLVTDYGERWLGLVDGCSKLLYRVNDGAAQLFDICADPAESHDLADVQPERVEKYAMRLTGWAQATRSQVLATKR